MVETPLERSSEVALGGRRQRRTAVRRQVEAHLEEMQEDVVVKREQLCKMEEEVEFGTGGSKDKIIAKEGEEETLRQDSYEDISTMESKSKQEDSGKENGVGVKSYQPLLLHRAPRYIVQHLHLLAPQCALGGPAF